MNIYLSDLDGTLLDRTGRLSISSREKLDMMLAQGLPFSVATARGWSGARRVLGDIAIRIPVIVRNGAYVVTYKSGDILHANLMDSSLAQEIASFFTQNNTSPAIAVFENGKEHMYGTKPKNLYMETYASIRSNHGSPPWEEVESITPLLRSPVAQFNIIDEGEKIIAFKEALSDIFGDTVQLHTYENALQSGWRMLSILAASATKGNAAHWLMDHLGSSAEKLTAFGDNHNDIPMLTMAGTSVAVRNAQPAVLDLADHIVASNMENSVVNFIEQDWQKNIG